MMATIPTSRRRGYQFRANELNNLLLFLLPVRLASLQPPVAKVLGPVGQREIAVVRFALRSTVEGRDAQEMVRTRMVCRHQIVW